MRLFLRLLERKNSRIGSAFLSFERPLTQLCRRFPLEQVLEFGPGYSTRILLECSGAEIISVEAKLLWYLKWRCLLHSSRLRLCYKASLDALKEMLFDQHLSLVFVDAGDRVSLLKSVSDLLDPSGMVFLHDAHREEYEPGIRHYPYRYFPERHSCILFTKKYLRDAVAEAIPSDYSCNCKYCSPEDRRAYFSRLAE